MSHRGILVIHRARLLVRNRAWLATLLFALSAAFVVACGSSLDGEAPAGAPTAEGAGVGAEADAISTAEKVNAQPTNTPLPTPKVVTPTFTPTPDDGNEEEGAAEIALTYRVHRVRSDGTGFERITDEPGSLGDWSPDGDRIVLDMGSYGSDAIHIANPDGTAMRTFEGTERASDPAWSPDGEHIAWTGVGERGRAVIVADSDGADRREITVANGEPHTYHRPVWSPDGSRIAFVVSNGSGRDIYVAKADGTRVTQLTDHPASDSGPTWSPGGSRIAFGSSRNGNGDIYAVDADGGGLTQLTDHPAIDGRPVWSPGGNQILFVSNRASAHPDGRQIFVMDPDGSDVVNLTPDSRLDDFPAWSPDGSEIAFASHRGDGGRAIFVMNADGSDPHLLTPDRTRDQTGPTWSPDGRWIYFIATESGLLPAPTADTNGDREESSEDRVRGTEGQELETPAVAEIICHPDGDTQLLASEVVASADGVHFRIENRADEPVSMSGLELKSSLEAGETRDEVTDIPPGEHQIGCFPYSQHGGGEPDRTSLTVSDPEDYWVSPELQCADLSFVEIPRRVPGASGLMGNPGELVFQKLSGLRDSDTIEQAGYPQTNNPVIRAVRDGRTIATVEYEPAPDGGWFIGKVSGCKGLAGLEVG